MKEESPALKQFPNFKNQASQIDKKSQKNNFRHLNLMTEVYEESMSLNKENHTIDQEKKIKLRLKTNVSRELQRKIEVNSVCLPRRESKQNFHGNNFGVKVVHKNQKTTLNKSQKKRKIDNNFKPNVVYFELKSLKDCAKPTLQIKKENPKQQKVLESKEKCKTKNYKLSSFLSQMLTKLIEIYPQFLGDEVSLKVLGSKEVHYSDLLILLHSLGMIRHFSEQKYNIQSEDQKSELQKAYLLWKILKSNQSKFQQQDSSFKGMNFLNLIAILTVIYNVSFESIQEFIATLVKKAEKLSVNQVQTQENRYLSVKPALEPHHLFFIKNKSLLKPFEVISYREFLILNPNDQTKNQIVKEFQLFRLNRLKIQNFPKITKSNLDLDTFDEEPTVQTFLSPKSHELAITRRLKILEEIQNSEQSQPQNQSNSQINLNFFLSYKKSHHFSDLQPAKKVSNSQNQENPKKQSKKAKEIKGKFIASKRIKFSELNVVKNMEKARKIKLQKQMILQKGWTNSGQACQRLSKISQAKSRAQTNFNKENSEAKNANKQKSLTKTSKSIRNLLENRKSSIPKLSVAEKARLEAKQFFSQKFHCDEENKKQQKVLQLEESDKKTVIQHESEEQSEEISISELQPIQHQNTNFNQEEDFLIEDDEPFERLNESLKNDQDAKGVNLEEQGQIEPESGSKTFRTEVNDEIETQNPTSIAQKYGTQNRASQQTRVIKSYLKIPILYVDVNMDESKKERIIIYEEDNPTNLAQQFGRKHGLDALMVGRLEQMLKQQISGILGRIDEEEEDDEAYDNSRSDLEEV